MERIICLAIGYVCGLLQTGYLVGKLNHIDIRQQGSGNAGSTNALRVMGWKAGGMTFAGDVLKCVAAVVIVRLLFQENHHAPLFSMYAAAGATLGHNFPFYLHFKGGKGIAVLAGIVVSSGWMMVPIPLMAFLIPVLLTRYISLGSLMAYVMFFLEMIFYGQMGGLEMDLPARVELYVVVFLLMALAWYRHKENIRRLLSGTENQLGKTKKG